MGSGPVSNLPPLPPGFQIESSPKKSAAPPLPPGFVLEGAKPTAVSQPQQPDQFSDLPVPGNPNFHPMDPNDWGPLPNLLPLQTNIKTKETRFVVPKLIQDIGSALALPGEILSGQTPFDPRVSMQDQDPATLDKAAILGGLLAGGAPLGTMRPTARNLVNAEGQAMPRLVANDLEANNIAPAALGPRIAQQGPAGILGDVSPRLQARVGAVANTPGPGQDMLVEALMARRAGANSRIKSSVGDTFGPEPIPSQVAAEMDVERRAANANYEPVFAEKAMSGATPAEALYDVAPILAAIDEQLPNFVGGTRTQIERVKRMLRDPQTGQLVTDPKVVLAVRHELDGMINALKGPNGNTTTLAALGDLRSAIDQDLAFNVPGLKAADAQRAEVAAQQEAFELGGYVLKGGDNAIHPVDLQAALDTAGGPHGTFIGPRIAPSKAPLRLSQGTLAEIYRVIGTTANDRVALKQVLRGEGSWNREKLVSIFGEAKAQKLIDLLEAEATMQRTEEMAFGNSKTETVRGAKEGIEAPQSGPGLIRNAMNFKFGDAAANLGDWLVSGMSNTKRQSRNAEIAKALLSQGGWRPGPVIGGNGGALSPLTNAAVAAELIDQGKRGPVSYGR